MQQVWRDYLKDSSWVTIGWEWFQNLLGRAVEAVLWVTMVFSCYQLIPAAPQAPVGISTFMFILQFIGLDVGGIGLNKLAQGQGLHKWAYARVVAYILIGITLVTVAYAGVERAVKIDPSITFGIEIVLVVARSIMTVLYGQAIHSLKQHTQNMRSLVEELRATLHRITEELRATKATHSQNLQAIEATRKTELQATKATHSQELRSMVTGYETRIEQLCNELQATKAIHETALQATNAMQERELQATVTGYQAQIGHLQSALRAMQATYEQGLQSTATGYETRIESLEDELRATKEKLTKAMSRKREAADRAMVVSVDRQPVVYGSPVDRDTDYQITAMGSSSKSHEYIAADDGTMLAITDGHGQTMIATGGHRDRIKQAMLVALQDQRELDYRDIAATAGVGYSTVKKYAPEIKQELAQSSEK